jgi:Double zinc ribbon
VIASTFGSTHDFFNSGAWFVIRNLLIFFALVFWAATIWWIYKDAKRRIEDPWLVGVSCLLGVVVPFFGPFIYMLFRPPEYLDDVRERELEISAMEDRLVKRDLHCPVCRTEVDSTFLVCPICTTKLKQACVTCKQPLEALWQVCPYCETPVEPSTVALPQFESRRRRRAESE